MTLLTRWTPTSPMSTSNELPQVCDTCHKLKLAELGTFYRDRDRYNVRWWRCHACHEKTVERKNRKDSESPPERRLRKALAGLRHQCVAEYELGPYTYDFAFPRLMLLIELDSKTYHRTRRQLRVDSLKDGYAKRNEWKLQRIKVSPSFVKEAFDAIAERAAELGV